MKALEAGGGGGRGPYLVVAAGVSDEEHERSCLAPSLTCDVHVCCLSERGAEAARQAAGNSVRRFRRAPSN